jgi:hypothetical protein
MLILASGIVVEQVWDRKRLQQVRAAREWWKDTAAGLSPQERREVVRAVQGGRAVNDPWLADAAIVLASSVVAETRTPRRRINEALFFSWWLMAPISAGIRHRWGWMVALSILPMMFLALTVWFSRYRKAAAAALAANRRVQPPARPPVVQHGPDLPRLDVGLPRSVARARRLSGSGER